MLTKHTLSVPGGALSQMSRYEDAILYEPDRGEEDRLLMLGLARYEHVLIDERHELEPVPAKHRDPGPSQRPNLLALLPRQLMSCILAFQPTRAAFTALSRSCRGLRTTLQHPELFGSIRNFWDIPFDTLRKLPAGCLSTAMFNTYTSGFLALQTPLQPCLRQLRSLNVIFGSRTSRFFPLSFPCGLQKLEISGAGSSHMLVLLRDCKQLRELAIVAPHASIVNESWDLSPLSTLESLTLNLHETATRGTLISTTWPLASHCVSFSHPTLSFFALHGYDSEKTSPWLQFPRLRTMHLSSSQAVDFSLLHDLVPPGVTSFRLRALSIKQSVVVWPELRSLSIVGTFFPNYLSIRGASREQPLALTMRVCQIVSRLDLHLHWCHSALLEQFRVTRPLTCERRWKMRVHHDKCLERIETITNDRDTWDISLLCEEPVPKTIAFTERLVGYHLPPHLRSWIPKQPKCMERLPKRIKLVA